MYKVKGYLNPLYRKSNTLSIRFLEYFGAHVSLNSILKELEQDFKYNGVIKEEDYFEFVFQKAYTLYTSDIDTYSEINRLKNIYTVNSLQYNRLKYNKFNIVYPVVDYFKQHTESNSLLYNKCIKLSPNLFSDIKTRTFVLYHRSYASDYLNNELNFGVDIFQLILIYRTIYQLIVDKKTTLFNNIQIVSRYNNLPEIMYKVLDKYTIPHNNSFSYNSSQLKFLQRTGIFANTFHFFGGELPDSSMYTIPVITYAHFYQNDLMNVVKNKYIIPFFYYPGMVSELGELLPEVEADYLMDGRLVTSRDLKETIKEKFNNTTIRNIIKETVNCITSLEKKMIEDEIYE